MAASWWGQLTQRGMRLPLIYSPRLRRADWLLTMAVVSWVATLALVIVAWALGRDVPEGARSLLHTVLGGTLLAYVAKSLPERRVRASMGAKETTLEVDAGGGPHEEP